MVWEDDGKPKPYLCRTISLRYGKEIIRLVKERAAEGHLKLTKLSGRVKPQNAVSFYFFIDNGFEEKIAGTKNTCCLNMI